MSMLLQRWGIGLAASHIVPGGVGLRARPIAAHYLEPENAE